MISLALDLMQTLAAVYIYRNPDSIDPTSYILQRKVKIAFNFTRIIGQHE